MRYARSSLMLFVLAACETTSTDRLVANDNNANSTATGDATIDGDPGPLPVLPAGLTLPASWQGQGVLAMQPDRVPVKAPDWAKALVQVVTRDNKHFLETTGRADRIKNPALARSTAENRARAELAKWLNTERFSGGEVIDVYVDKKSKGMFVRVAVEVPEGWLPGQPAVGIAVPPSDTQNP